MSQALMQVWEVLDTVKDPEIDTVSIVDLGMVEDVKIHDTGIAITLLPTFSGCPALDIIKNNVIQSIQRTLDYSEIKVEFSFSPAWTSDRITEKGRAGLKAFGISPPPKKLEENDGWVVECPYCGSKHVRMENMFGPTSCRSILYCKNCKNPFEAMKPIINFKNEVKQ